MNDAEKAAIDGMYRALGVIVYDPRIRAFLSVNDNKALSQCIKAMDDARFAKLDSRI